MENDEVITVCETCVWCNPETQHCVYRKCFVSCLCMRQLIRDLCYRSIYTNKKPVVDKGQPHKEL